MWQQKEEIKNINDTKASFELIWLLVNQSCVLVYDSQRPCGNSCLFQCYVVLGFLYGVKSALQNCYLTRGKKQSATGETHRCSQFTVTWVLARAMQSSHMWSSRYISIAWSMVFCRSTRPTYKYRINTFTNLTSVCNKGYRCDIN